MSAWDVHIILSSFADLQHFTVILAEIPTASVSYIFMQENFLGRNFYPEV